MSTAPMPVITETAFHAEPWQDDALCMQTDPEAFFPERGQSPANAKATCHKCLVEAECLAYALRNDEKFGVWGGKTEEERRALRAAAKGSAASRVEERHNRVRELHEQGWEDPLIADALGCHVRTVLRIRAKLEHELPDQRQEERAQPAAA